MNSDTARRGFWYARFCLRRPVKALPELPLELPPVPGDGRECCVRYGCELVFGEDEA